MTDLITAEEAEKLLDGSTPGPWEWTTGRFSNNPYLSPNILLLAFDGGGPDGVDPNDAANARLIAAAPDLARTVIALHAQLADAHAAQAMVVGRAEEKRFRATVKHDGAEVGDLPWLEEFWAVRHDDLHTLAPASGLAILAELRAERDRLLSDYAAQVRDIIAQQLEITSLRTKRDRLSAANAVLEAKVAGLRAAFRVNMLRFGPPGTSHEEIDAAIDAALATQEAGNG